MEEEDLDYPFAQAFESLMASQRAVVVYIYPWSPKKECRFCGHNTLVGSARCSGCGRTLWQHPK